MTDEVFKIEMAYGAKSVPKSSEDIAFILGTLGYTNMGFIKVDDYFGHGSGAPRSDIRKWELFSGSP